MFHSLDDIVLYSFAQLHKVGAVTSHPDDKIAIFFRVLLRVQQGLPTDDIELHLLAAASEVGLDEGREFPQVLGAF